MSVKIDDVKVGQRYRLTGHRRKQLKWIDDVIVAIKPLADGNLVVRLGDSETAALVNLIDLEQIDSIDLLRQIADDTKAIRTALEAQEREQSRRNWLRQFGV